MSTSLTSRLFRPETLTSLGIIVVAGLLLIPTFELRAISALLPGAMLAGLIVLALLLLIRDQRKAAAGEAADQMTESPNRVLLAFALILIYTLAVDFIGFYIATAISIPAVTAIFGYRNPVGLLLATVIVLGAIYLVFDFGMSREFPMGRIW